MKITYIIDLKIIDRKLNSLAINHCRDWKSLKVSL